MANSSGGHVNRGADVEMGAKTDDVHFTMDGQKKAPKSERSSKISTCHIIVLLLLVITVIVLAVALVTRGFGSWADEPVEGDREVCDTKSCAEASARITSSMDETANPCQDFYQYACGGFLKKNVIPPTETEISTWGTLPKEITVKIKSLLESKSPLDSLNAIKQTKIYYKSCMDEEAIEAAGAQPMKDVVMAHGGWGPLGASWNEANFNLEDYMVQLDPLGQSLFTYSLGINPFNATQRFIGIGQASLTIANPAVYANPQFLTELQKVIVAVLEALGVDPAIRLAEIPKMVNFEVELTKIFAFGGPPSKDQIMTLSELATKVPGIDFLKILNAGMAPYTLTGNTEVQVSAIAYLQSLTALIGKTDKRTVASYILYSAMRPYIGKLNKAVRKLMEDIQALLTGASGEPARYTTCVAVVNEMFGMPIARLFVEEYYSEGNEEIERMTEQLEEVFKERLDNVNWLDEVSRQKAETKAEVMLLRLGYPTRIMNNAKLEIDFEGVDLKADEYLKNAVKVKKVQNSLIAREIQKKHNRAEWITPMPLTVNAFYSPQENAMIFPLGILLPPFFDPSGPKSLNYGAIGKVIGHEITHGFDSMGRRFDKDGNMKEWMTQTAVDNFNEKAKCIEEQYSELTIEQLGTKVNGQLTLGENIADAGAIRQSFQAYQSWVEENGPEKSLPGLSLSHNKLFFLGFGQLYCRRITTQFLQQMAQMDNHTPHEQRVLGILMNSVDFARTFNCPSGSKYNPKKKCSVW